MSSEGRSNTFKIIMLFVELFKAFLSIFGPDLKPGEKQQVIAALSKSDSMMA